MTLPASCWTSSPGNWSPKALWTDAPVPADSSASLRGEVPSVTVPSPESRKNVLQEDLEAGLARKRC